MGWFRKKTEVLDAEHLLHDANQEGSAAVSEDFRLTVSDVFSIKGRGTVVTGKVEVGSISVGADIAVSRNGESVGRTKVAGVEMFRKTLDTAVAGQQVGLLLDEVERQDVAAGDVLRN
jgi:translation elongation factor EF-Tu-like GTPase